MYKNISKSLLAAASLAMMTAAKTVKVTGDDLHLMNETGERFEMSKDETLTIMMDYPSGAKHWNLPSNAYLMGAVYHSSEPYYMCNMDTCTIAWDIVYSYSASPSSELKTYVAELAFVDTNF